MRLDEMRQGVRILIPNSTLTDSDVDGYINEAVQLAGGMVGLPVFKMIDVVQTTALSYVTLTGLTGGFSGRLVRAKSALTDTLSIYQRLELMLDDYPGSDFTAAGDVEAVCLEGTNLWYVGIPAVAETLTILYFRNPPTLTDDSHEPSAFPEYLHRQLFINGAAMLVWEGIEDGVDGDKLNTNTHKGNFNTGISLLRAWVARNKAHYISSRWSA